MKTNFDDIIYIQRKQQIRIFVLRCKENVVSEQTQPKRSSEMVTFFTFRVPDHYIFRCLLQAFKCPWSRGPQKVYTSHFWSASVIGAIKALCGLPMYMYMKEIIMARAYQEKKHYCLLRHFLNCAKNGVKRSWLMAEFTLFVCFSYATRNQ